MHKRFVPLTLGLAALVGVVWAMLDLGGVAGVLVGGMLLAFAVSSLKTAFSASSKEIEELTGRKPTSEETKERLRRRL